MPEKKLTKEQQRFIIEKLADYNSYPEIKEKFETRYNQSINTTLIAYYNPDSTSGGTPSRDLCDYYYDLREDEYERIEEIPISHPIYRLERLMRIVKRRDNADASYQEDKVIMKALREAREEWDRIEERTGESEQTLLGSEEEKEQVKSGLAGLLKELQEEDDEIETVPAEVIEVENE